LGVKRRSRRPGEKKREKIRKHAGLVAKGEIYTNDRRSEGKKSLKTGRKNGKAGKQSLRGEKRHG